MLRARYLRPFGIEDELQRSADLFDPPNGQLIVRTGDSETPPASTALLFAYDKTRTIPCRIGLNTKQVEAHEYTAATRAGTAWSWYSDLNEGRLGYFLIGGPGRANLWRIRRAEADFANRFVFTIVPVAPMIGMPAIDLSSVHDERMRRQIEQHLREFNEVFARQLPLRTINAAKDVCECVLYDILLRCGKIKGGKRELGALLKELFELLDSGNNIAVPFHLLHFHQIHKIRLLHGRIHAGRSATEGPIRPELALSVAEDLQEVLSAAGLTIAVPS